MNIAVTRCKWCGELLLDVGALRQVRADKQFCSANHRSRYSQWLKRVQKHERVAIAAIKELAEYLKHPNAQVSALEAMVRIETAIKQEQAWAGVKAVR